MKKVTYLLMCVFEPQTPIPVMVLFVNLLIDFDASVPIDQTELAHCRAHLGSWMVLVNNMPPVSTPSYSPGNGQHFNLPSASDTVTGSIPDKL